MTARLHQGERLFDGIQALVVGIINAEAARHRTRVVAHAVMSNHLHILMIQGVAELERFMQPVMRRTAVLVKSVYGRRGRIFEAPYSDQVCSDPRYFRNVIAYIHLNPVRAGLCRESAAYPFTTQAVFLGSSGRGSASQRFEAERALRAFAPSPDSDMSAIRANYLNFLQWRLEADRLKALDPGNPDAAAHLPIPDCFGGDVLWSREAISGNAVRHHVQRWPRRPAEDLSTIARRVTAGLEPHVPLDMLRSASKVNPVVRARHTAIAHCLAGGYRPKQIARYFRVSVATVSRVAVSLRLSIA